MRVSKPLPSSMSGIAGEYFVAAELSRRGIVASVTLRNSKGPDILASTPDGKRTVAIQVKTNKGSKSVWVLNEKSEADCSDNLYYVFVALNGVETPPSYHVVPSKE